MCNNILWFVLLNFLHHSECHTVKFHNAECHTVKFHNAECHTVEFHNAECHTVEFHNAEWNIAECHYAKYPLSLVAECYNTEHRYYDCHYDERDSARKSYHLSFILKSSIPFRNNFFSCVYRLNFFSILNDSMTETELIPLYGRLKWHIACISHIGNYLLNHFIDYMSSYFSI
jgi:hypothetical protein